MLYWAAVFFIVAVAGGFFGFGGVAVASAGMAKILFFLFIVGFVISLILHFARSVDNKTKI